MTLLISLCSSPPSGWLDTKKPQVRFTYLLLTMPGGMKGSSEGLFWASFRMVSLKLWFIRVFISPSTVRRQVSFGLPLLCLPCLLPGFFQSMCPIIIIIIWTCFKVHHSTLLRIWSMRFDEKTFQSISGFVQQSTCHGVTVLRKSTHFNSWFCVIRFSI